jgi:hypothetical protein
MWFCALPIATLMGLPDHKPHPWGHRTGRAPPDPCRRDMESVGTVRWEALAAVRGSPHAGDHARIVTGLMCRQHLRRSSGPSSLPASARRRSCWAVRGIFLPWVSAATCSWKMLPLQSVVDRGGDHHDQELQRHRQHWTSPCRFRSAFPSSTSLRFRGTILAPIIRATGAARWRISSLAFSSAAKCRREAGMRSCRCRRGNRSPC